MSSEKFFWAKSELQRLQIIAIKLEWYYSKLQEMFILQRQSFFFSKDGIKPGRSKLEETEKMHTPQNAKHLRSFLVFPLNYVKGFISNYSTLKYNHTSLKRIFTKESRF